MGTTNFRHASGSCPFHPLHRWPNWPLCSVGLKNLSKLTPFAWGPWNFPYEFHLYLIIISVLSVYLVCKIALNLMPTLLRVLPKVQCVEQETLIPFLNYMQSAGLKRPNTCDLHLEKKYLKDQREYMWSALITIIII